MIGLNATEAKHRFFNIIKGASEEQRAYRISHAHGTAVLLSEAEYVGLIESIELASLPIPELQPRAYS